MLISLLSSTTFADHMSSNEASAKPKWMGMEPEDEDEQRAKRIVSTSFGKNTREKPLSQREAMRLAFIERLFVEGIPEARIFTLARRPTQPTDDKPAGLGIGYDKAKRLLGVVKERLVRESESLRPTNKAAAERRILGDIQAAKAAKNWAAVRGFESLLADIQGTKDPIRVDVSVTQRSAVVHLIGNMTDGEFTELVDEYEELEARATLAEAQARRTITVAGVSVPDEDE